MLKMSNDLVFIVQARLGSTRLPNKLVLPFWKEKSILDLILEKITRKFPDIPVILATSVNPKDDKLRSTAERYGCFFFRGSEDDVLNRFIEAALKHDKRKIIRICADNPFLDTDELAVLIENINNDDYISFHIDNIPTIKTHFGFWAEYTTLESLQKVSELTENNLYHEHVTNFIYENPNFFNIKFINPKISLSVKDEIRMTLDTLQDFDMLSKIYSRLHNRYNDDFGIPEIVEFINENHDFKIKMKEQILLNTK